MTRRQSGRQQTRFLATFRKTGNVTQACGQTKTQRSTVYKWQEHDDAFAAAYRQAELEATELLEAEAHRRAVDGTRRLKFGKDGDALTDPETGELYVELQYSDALLMFLLKARAPEKYRERLDVTRVSEPVPKVYAGVGPDDL